MSSPARIPWVVLILGAGLGLVVAAAVAALVGPLALSQINGGSSYRVRDSAMAPVLQPGDWVLAEALEPGQAPPRGTIVAYYVPRTRGTEQIGRVIGLPGESVQMRGGAVYINGRRAQMEQLEDRVIPRRKPARGLPAPDCMNPRDVDPGLCHQEVWRETFADGTSTLVLNTSNKIGLSLQSSGRVRDDTQVVRVPYGQVFLLGDNRDLANDSRMALHGTVPIEDLRYRIWLIHTSLDRSARFLTPRWERFFLRVE